MWIGMAAEEHAASRRGLRRQRLNKMRAATVAASCKLGLGLLKVTRYKTFKPLGLGLLKEKQKSELRVSRRYIEVERER